MSLFQAYAHYNKRQNIINSEHASTENKNSLIETNNVLKAVPVHINTNKENNSHTPRNITTYRSKDKNITRVLERHNLGKSCHKQDSKDYTNAPQNKKRNYKTNNKLSCFYINVRSIRRNKN